MDGWRMSFHLGRPIFRGYVSFREGNLLLPFFGERRIISYLWPPPNLHLTPVFLNSKHSKWSSWGILEIDTERSNTSLKFLKGNAWFGKPRHCWLGLHHVPPDFRRWDESKPWRKYLVEHIERSSVWSIPESHFGQSRVCHEGLPILLTALPASCWCLWSCK